MNPSSANDLRLRLRRTGLSDAAIDAAWPTWWVAGAEASLSARSELGLSLARKLGLDVRTILDDAQEPRFVWQGAGRFKHLAAEAEVERDAITSFGAALGTILLAGTPDSVSIGGHTAQRLRDVARGSGSPYVRLLDLLSLCWSVGIPVVHLRVFPLMQKRMAAMTVHLGDRWAILLGKDSMYPAHVAFYLAHEVGHIALQHLKDEKVLVDLESSTPEVGPLDDEEVAADAFALELLTGMSSPTVLPLGGKSTASELGRVALSAGGQLGIEPGVLALCFGHATQDWAMANAAMPHIYQQAKPVWREVNLVAESQLAIDQIGADSQEYLRAVLGEGQTE